jgi:hypothetical protein
MVGLCAAIAYGDLELLGSAWRADVPFPEFAKFWTDSTLADWETREAAGKARPLGGYLHLFVRNTGSQPVRIEDVLFEGMSLKRAIAFSDQRKFKRVARAASIYFSDLPVSDRDRLIIQGEPVWWKAEPSSVPPSGAAEVVIRLRRAPAEGAVELVVRSTAGAVEVSVPIKESPCLDGISFSSKLDTAYVYTRHPRPGQKPSKLLMDGVDITADSQIGYDPALSLTPIVYKLKSPVERGSFHSFQAVYSDGSQAIGGVRAWGDELMYGVWGSRPGKETEIEIGRSYVKEIAEHNMNTQMEMIGSEAVRAFMLSEEGRELMRSLGIGRVVGDPGKARTTPAAYYIADEPDTADYRVQGVPVQSKIGSIAQGLIARAEELRKADPLTPNMLNVDMTFKPDNWYTYGQLPDMYAADPYYQTRLAQAYLEKPALLPLFTKATFVYAVGSVCQSACAPNPLHLILNCTRVQKQGRMFRFGTPEEKRIEVYYALGAGAKGLSYWWFTPIAPDAKGSHGCGGSEPEAKALWREIGLLGAEVRTIGDLMTMGCPASIPVVAPDKLWVRSLASGLDTLVLLCVNDDYLNDRKGTVIKPLEEVEATVTLPAWLDAKQVFEVTYKGMQDMQWERSGSRVNVRLGTLNVTRLIIITTDPGLRERLQKGYESRFAANVTKLTGNSSRLCVIPVA